MNQKFVKYYDLMCKKKKLALKNKDEKSKENVKKRVRKIR